jgi:Spy/CpxP family protein refolding chaperone
VAGHVNLGLAPVVSKAVTLRIASLVLFAIVVGSAGAALGSHWPGGYLGKHQGKFWKKEKVREKLQLSDDEVRNLEQIFARYQQQLIDLEADVQKKKAELDALLLDDQAADERIMAEVDALEQARAKLGKVRVTMLLQMRRALTPAQRDKLADLADDD